MPKWPKPAEGSWTQHYPELGTAPISYEDSISPEFYELERKAIFERSWLNVGRVEQLPRNGSYFTKDLAVANTSVIIVRGLDGEVRAFHNICRHRGNKLVWQDYPREEVAGSARQFVCKYHGWKYDLDGACAFVQQEGEFFDFDKADFGLVPVHCDVWAGFIFVNLDRGAEPVTARLPRPDDHRDRGLSVRQDDRALLLPRDRSAATGRSSWTPSRSSTTHRFCTRASRPRDVGRRCTRTPASRRRTTRSTARTAS